MQAPLLAAAVTPRPARQQGSAAKRTRSQTEVDATSDAGSVAPSGAKRQQSGRANPDEELRAHELVATLDSGAALMGTSKGSEVYNAVRFERVCTNEALNLCVEKARIRRTVAERINVPILDKMTTPEEHALLVADLNTLKEKDQVFPPEYCMKLISHYLLTYFPNEVEKIAEIVNANTWAVDDNSFNAVGAVEVEAEAGKEPKIEFDPLAPRVSQIEMDPAKKAKELGKAFVHKVSGAGSPCI